jgi:uncharacterized protein (DUF4415 family)
MTRNAEKKGAHYHYFAEAMRRVEAALHGQLARSDLIPDGWAAIARRPPRPAKAQITLRLDGDVLAFFRGMGAGYQTRMNDVLAAYMHARVAGVVRGAEAAGGSVLAAMQAREADEARLATLRRQMIAATEADQARRAAEFEALPEAGKRKVRLEELKRLAALRKQGVGVGGKVP